MRSLLACLVAIMIVGAVVASGASAERPEYGRCLQRAGGKWKDGGCKTPSKPGEEKFEWYPGFSGERPIVRRKFTVTSSPGTLAQLGTAVVKFTCSSLQYSGEYTGAKAVSTSGWKLTGCESSGLPCSSEGGPPGEIVTVPLEGMLGVTTAGMLEGKRVFAKDKLGDELFPVGGGAEAEKREWAGFKCAGLDEKLRGHHIDPVIANAMRLSETIKSVSTEGKQKPEKFVEPLTGPLILELSQAGGPFEPFGMTVTTVRTNEEKIEVSSVN
jgi:hypothetical protein